VGDADYRQALREVFGPAGASSVGVGETPSIALPARASALVNRARDVDVLDNVSPASN
jgi:hypothetical protein